MSGALVYRTARKRHKCVNGPLAERGTRSDVTSTCKVWIERGDRYREGDNDPYSAGGFGKDYVCLGCDKAGFA